MEAILAARQQITTEWAKFLSDLDPKLLEIFKKFSLATGICLSLLLLRNVFNRIYRRIYKYPPGLFGIPYFGSFFTLAAYGDDKFYTKLIPKYGPITMFDVGNTSMISINDANLIQTMYNSNYCLQRPQLMTQLFSLTGKTACEFSFTNVEWYVRMHEQ